MQNSSPGLLPPDNIFVIGCGGVASYLLPCLLKLTKEKSQVVLVDADILEHRNLDRQLFRADQIGQTKAKALSEVVGSPRCIRVVPSFFTPGSLDIPEGSLLLGCADNHAARKAILEAVDDRSGRAIIGGNEYTDADAYYYDFTLRDSPLDPRQYFPEINTDKSGDPTRPQSCQGEAQVASPQLALANMSAANHMLWLFWFYFAEIHRMPDESKPYWPVRHYNTFTRMGSELIRDKDKREAA